MFTVPEVKILLLLCYVTVFGMGLGLNYCIWNNILDRLLHTEFSYFICTVTYLVMIQSVRVYEVKTIS